MPVAYQYLYDIKLTGAGWRFNIRSGKTNFSVQSPINQKFPQA
jgi:hypothetical protein